MRSDAGMAMRRKLVEPVGVLVIFLSGLVISGAAEPLYQWQQDDDSLALVSGERVVWQLNFKKDEGKPYFHPLTLTNGVILTALRPQDHPWHRGLWWSWKHVDGVNYWEENKKTGLSDGRTELVNVRIQPASDFSARVEMELNYRLPDKAPVMTERRLITVSTPDANGNYSIDWNTTFAAGSKALKLDRTPPKNFSGGYAGLSCRMSKDCKGWTYTASDGTVGAANIYGRTAKWVDYSSSGGGIAIFDHPSNLRHPTPWYPNTMPFFSPAMLFHEPYTFPAGKTLMLRYRIFVHSAPVDKNDLETEWKKFTEE